MPVPLVESLWTELEKSACALEPGSRAGLAALRAASAHLSEPEREGLSVQLVPLMKKRCQLIADRVMTAGIGREKIEAPIVIIGLPRSGTSLLHALLSEDPGNRAPRAWELLTPSPPAPSADETAQRIALSSAAVAAFIQTMPDLLKLHPYWDQGGNASIECEDITQMSFISPYFPSFFDIPDYSRWLAQADHGAAYRAHHDFLQHLQWRAPARRWALKGVTHGQHLDLLLKTYPDACLVWPHRDPAEQFASMATIVAVVRRARDPKVLRGIFEEYLASTARGVDAALKHPAVQDGRVLHISFSDLNKAPQKSIRAIYDRLGIAPSIEHETRMKAWLSAPGNDASRHGRADVNLARFGATIDEIRHQFAAYYDSGLLSGRAT